jgi:hypothetical protein
MMANGHNGGMTRERVVKDELQAAIQARGELGEDMEPAIVDAFVARIEKRLADRDEASAWALQQRREHQKEMVLGSMGISIPLFVVAAVFTGLAGVIAVLVALAVIAVITTRSP